MGQDILDFRRPEGSDWMRSLKVLARAQSMAWAALPMSDKRSFMKLAEAETQVLEEQSALAQQMRVLIHGQQ